MSEGLSKLESTIAKLEESIEECREVTREAHAAKKDLEHVCKEAKHLLDGEAQERINLAVRAGLAEWADVVQSQITEKGDVIVEKLTVLTDTVMHSPHGDKPSLNDMMAAWLREQGYDPDDMLVPPG